MRGSLPFYINFLDALLHPFMAVLGGFNGDSVQKTHPWHVKRFDPHLINARNSLEIPGTDNSLIRKTWSGLFHMPIFGGWTSYVVLAPKENVNTWYVGWKTKRQCQVNIIPLSGGVKLLVGPEGESILFFGLDRDGKFIKLKIVAFGKNGDKKFKNLPLL